MATGRVTSRQREALVIALVAVAVILAALAGPLVVRWHDPPAWMDASITLPPMDTATPPPAEEDVEFGTRALPGWVGDVVRWVAIAAVVVGLALLARRLRGLLRGWWQGIDRGNAAPTAPGGLALDEELDETAQEVLHEGVTQAWRALRADLPPGDAVVAAWLALEEAAGECGIEREPAQTASEFTLALLDRTPADPRAARALLRLYHGARFSEHPVTPADVTAAGQALDTLAAGLAGVRPGAAS